MLVARGSLTLRRAHLRYGFALGHRSFVQVVSRTGLTYDTRFMPAIQDAPQPSVCLYVLVRGVWQAHSGGPRFEGPSAFLLEREHYDGGNGARSLNYRTTGEPYAAVELHIPARDVIALEPKPAIVELDDRAWTFAQNAVTLGLEDDVALAAHVTGLIHGLVELGLVSARAGAAFAKPTPRIHRTVWRALRPMVEGFVLSASVKQVSADTALSERQATRNIHSFLERFIFPFPRWKAFMRFARLRFAVLLLSADEVTVHEVARAVGYGDVTAMSRAFRDAACMAPSDVRRLLAE